MSNSTTSSVPEVAPFDFANHRARAVERYQRLRPRYESFALIVRSILDQALRGAEVKVSSVEARAKSLESLGDKAESCADDDPTAPKYDDPLVQITDLAGIRVITFFLQTIQQVDRIIANEFVIIEKSDKADLLLRDEKLGYQSVHYIVELGPRRAGLPEYSLYTGLKAEIQLRTVLQHAWAEIEHDIQYKSVETIPSEIKRRFMALAGVLEIADREFQAVQLEDERLRQAARVSVREGQLEEVEITGDALKAYLDQRLGPDGRVARWSYDYVARLLRRFGFINFRQVEDCIGTYNDDQLSRAVHGTRQGQLTRFEDMLLAGLGDHFIHRHYLGAQDWWAPLKAKRLERIYSLGFPVGQYDPRFTEGVDQ